MSGIVADPDANTALGAARRAVRLAQAVRMDDLGHLPEWVTPDAQGAIAGLALGGKRRLLTVLATALFLAEREHRPRVDLALVQRAASLQTNAEAALNPAGARSAARRLLWLLALPLTLIAAIVAGQALRTRPAEAPAPLVARHAVVSPPAARHRPVAVAPALPHANATVVPWTPAEPTSQILLRSARPPAPALLASLQGESTFVSTALAPRLFRAVTVRYFYQEDRASADRIGRAILPAGATPVFTRAVSGKPPPPGTVELDLP